jgi:amidohydrolase
MIGAENIRPPARGMGAEDFGYFMQHAPGAMFFLGTRIEPEDRLHSPTFNLDEDALPLGSAMFAEAALKFLREGLG